MNRRLVAGKANARLIGGVLAACLVVAVLAVLFSGGREVPGPDAVVKREEAAERDGRRPLNVRPGESGPDAERETTAASKTQPSGSKEGSTTPEEAAQAADRTTSGSLATAGANGFTSGIVLNAQQQKELAERLAREEAERAARAAEEAAAAADDAAKDAANSKPAEISGRVTSSSGGPVEGARVQLLGVSTAITSQDGSYVLFSRKAGTVIVQALPPPDTDYAPGRSRQFAVVLGEKYPNVDFELSQGLKLKGIVVDSENQPLEGARITAFVDNTGVGATTDAEGRFEIDNVSADGLVQQLAVTLDGYEPEFRQALSVLDGEQRFVLNKQLAIELRVSWEMDNSPVTLYKYRILKPGADGLDWGVSPSALRVQSEDGTTEIKQLSEGEHRVDVTVLNSRNQDTDIRGSDRFQVTRETETSGLEVKIGLGRVLAGRVVMAETGEPVGGATVTMIPPTIRPGSFYLPDSSFTPSPVQTAADGLFTISGLPPGLYSFRAQKGSLQCVLPIDVNISYDSEPEPITIEIAEGGVIYGEIINEEGEAAWDARIRLSVQRPNNDGWDPKDHTPGNDGRYRIEGLPVGTHKFSVFIDNNEVETRNVDLAAGEEREINVDLSGAVTLKGLVSTNGNPGTGQISHLQFFGSDGSQTPRVDVKGDGTYSIKLKPGSYIVGARSSAFMEGQLANLITVASSPAEQQRDIDVPLADADVVIVFPEEGQFQRGELVISPRDRGSRYGFITRELTQSDRHIPEMIGGEYKATYTSDDGAWNGESAWVMVAEGAENTFLIDALKKVNSRRVGGWEPGQLSNTTATPLRFDVSGVVQSAGSASVLIDYERGRNPVEPSAVILLQNGSPIAEDNHLGWSGQEKWNNTYRFDIPPITPGARYDIEVHLRADGGSDSTGSVYMSLN
jgi:hypothetical protein